MHGHRESDSPIVSEKPVSLHPFHLVWSESLERHKQSSSIEVAMMNCQESKSLSHHG